VTGQALELRLIASPAFFELHQDGLLAVSLYAWKIQKEWIGLSLRYDGFYSEAELKEGVIVLGKMRVQIVYFNGRKLALIIQGQIADERPKLLTRIVKYDHPPLRELLSETLGDIVVKRMHAYCGLQK
jgi:hypothetical protein